MGFFLFLLVIAALAILMVVLLLSKSSPESEVEPPPRTLAKNLGSPLFSDNNETKTILDTLFVNQFVWVLTPYGPQRMQAEAFVEPGRVSLANAEFEAFAFSDPEYLSPEVAAKMGRGRGAWRLESILPTQTPLIPKNDPRWEAANRHWIEDAVDVDFFDDMVFYYFLFNGFDQPCDYYEAYEPPTFSEPNMEPPVVVEEPPAEESVEIPAEVNEGTFEPLPDTQPEPPPIPDCPTPEPLEVQSYDSPSYDSPSFDSPSFDSPSFDSGSSFDGGCDCGGCD